MATEFDQHECEYCEGSCIANCSCCDSEIDCEECHGTRKDPNQFDTKRYAKDRSAFDARMYEIAKQNPNGSVISLEFWKDGKTAGREGCNGDKLLLEDYRIAEYEGDEEPDEDDEAHQ
jgi:hypothetical protein